MRRKGKNKNYKRLALILSLVMLTVWAALGTGASVAWFADVSPTVTNIFHFADFDLSVSHKLSDGTWEEINAETILFDENALYEPGYVQVVYLRVDNKGDCDFTFKTAVNVTGYTIATNVYGHTFTLQDYLKFGLVVADSESAMKEGVANRDLAKMVADTKLNNYATQDGILEAGKSAYVALVLRMPEDVGNVANYRGEIVPRVDLGIIVTADQIRN